MNQLAEPVDPEPEGADGGEGANELAGGEEPSTLLERVPPKMLGLTVVAIALIFSLGFGFVVKETFEGADSDNEKVWSRHLFIFQSVFGIVSAIVGVIFSSTVYRPQLKQARRSENDAQTRAGRNEREAGAAKEHGKRKAAEARERVIEEAVRIALERPAVPGRGKRTMPFDASTLGTAAGARSLINEVVEGNDYVYLPRSADDVPPPMLTNEDLADAVAASREGE